MKNESENKTDFHPHRTNVASKVIITDGPGSGNLFFWKNGWYRFTDQQYNKSSCRLLLHSQVKLKV